jgi:alginate export protein
MTCLPAGVYAQQAISPLGAHSVANSRTDSEPPGWLFPVAKLDQALPSWLQFGGEYRDRLELPGGINRAPVSDSYLLDRLRANVTIQPTSWLGFHGEVQDARIFYNRHTPASSSYEDTWTLWEGYAQAGHSTQGWVDVLAGRQALRFGDERVIGPSNWSNVGRTFNVGRIDVHHGSYRVSLFAASVVPGDSAELHSVLPGNNLYGIYASLQNIIPQATLEPYVLWRVAPANAALPETLGRGHLNEVTIGLHWQGTLPADFDYDTEIDWQRGSLGSASIHAGAAYVGVGRRFVPLFATPRIFLEANYASGTKDRGGDHWGTFDQLYPSNHDKFGFADQVGRRNLVQFRLGIEENPSRKWKLKQAVEGYWLATASDNFYASSGAIAVAAHPGASRRIGTELDLIAEYQWVRGLSFGFGYARLFTGPFLKSTTPGHDYVYPHAYLQYNFSPLARALQP